MHDRLAVYIWEISIPRARAWLETIIRPDLGAGRWYCAETNRRTAKSAPNE
jgi:hypothetical protein